MNNKIKIIFLLAAVSIIFTLTILPALAENGEDGTIKPSDKLKTVGDQAGFEGTEDNLPEIVGGVIQIFLTVVGVIFMAYMVYAGYLWMTSHGEEEKVTKAKAIIKGSIIGIIVVFAAYAITYFVVNQMTETTGYTETITN